MFFVVVNLQGKEKSNATLDQHHGKPDAEQNSDGRIMGGQIVHDSSEAPWQV
jgi:hypothetical protein